MSAYYLPPHRYTLTKTGEEDRQLRAKLQEFAAWREANDRKNLSCRTNLTAR